MRIDGALRSWEDQRGQRALRMFLGSCGVEAAVASRIYRAWGTDSVGQLRADPYCITRLPGIGFHSADRLAMALGVGGRRAGADRGRPCCTCSEQRRVRRPLLPGHAASWNAAPRAPGSRASEGDGDRITANGDRRARGGALRDGTPGRPSGVEEELIYAAEMHARRAAPCRGRRARSSRTPRRSTRSRLERPARGEFRPTEEQWQAVRRALAHRLSILTGGPGTGKTTSMRVLVELLRASGATVRLCAPTGKAARRLAARQRPRGDHDPSAPLVGAGIRVRAQPGEPPRGHRHADRGRGEHAERAARGGAVRGDRRGDARAACGRHRPARGGRPGPRARGPDRERPRAAHRAHRGLPPGAALADRARRPRHQPRAPPSARSHPFPAAVVAREEEGPHTARDEAQEEVGARLLPDRARAGGARSSRRWSRSPASAWHRTSDWTRGSTCRCSRRCAAGAWASRRLNAELRGRLNPRWRAGAGLPPAPRRPRDPDTQRP